MQLTEHFTDYELGVDGADPRIVENARTLCATILEPIRERFGLVRIHDGYRPPEHNAAVGGKPTSFHLYEGAHAAADLDCPGASFAAVFDWIRIDSGLPFDEAILEHNLHDQPRCIHVQVGDGEPRRLALMGQTGAGVAYRRVYVAPLPGRR